MRYNIAQHASKGGIARANKLNPIRKIEIAREGAKASNTRYEQARASDNNSASDNDNLQERYNILVSFLRGKGISADEVIDSYYNAE